jgi:RNA 3'-terminal phosphate cyclase (ATP)
MLRTALGLAATSGLGFEAVYADVGRGSGLPALHLAVVRAAAMACEAHLVGAFEGSRDLRFEPKAPVAGRYDFALEPGTPTAHVMQTLLPILGRVSGESDVIVRGNTHAANGPTFHFVSRHWLPLVRLLGLEATLSLRKAGFGPRGEGEASARLAGADAPGRAAGGRLALETRGELVAVTGICGATRQQGDAARRMRDAAQGLLWERRRLESTWEQVEVSAGSPGAFTQIELVFEAGRAAFGALSDRQLSAEAAGERLARAGLRFLEGEAALDQHVAEQLLLPLAASRRGGRLSVDIVSETLLAMAQVAGEFGVVARVWGRQGGPGGLEVEAA